MSITVNEPYAFHSCLYDEYNQAVTADKIKDNDFYFISDKNILFIGKELYFSGISTVENDYPENPVPFKIYVKPDTLEAKFHNGTNYVTISPEISNVLNNDTDIGKLVTAGAIRTYITNQIGSSSLVNDVSYDSITGNFTFNFADNTTKVVNTPVENFLQNAVYEASTHILTLTMQSGNNLTIDLSTLIDTYTGGSTKAITTEISDNTILSTLKVSSSSGNNIVINNDGIFSAPVWKSL